MFRGLDQSIITKLIIFIDRIVLFDEKQGKNEIRELMI